MSILFRFVYADVLTLEQEIDEEDLQTLDTLLPPNAGERKTLADIIFSKIDSGDTASAAKIEKVHQGITCSLARCLDRPLTILNPR